MTARLCALKSSAFRTDSSGTLANNSSIFLMAVSDSSGRACASFLMVRPLMVTTCDTQITYAS